VEVKAGEGRPPLLVAEGLAGTGERALEEAGGVMQGAIIRGAGDAAGDAGEVELGTARARRKIEGMAAEDDIRAAREDADAEEGVRGRGAPRRPGGGRGP
jgi:hypothetical protein